MDKKSQFLLVPKLYLAYTLVIVSVYITKTWKSNSNKGLGLVNDLNYL